MEVMANEGGGLASGRQQRSAQLGLPASGWMCVAVLMQPGFFKKNSKDSPPRQ